VTAPGEIVCDCLVVGGGPAGAALAWRLANDGSRVVLVDGNRARHSGPYETLLPGALGVFAANGFAAVVREAAEPDRLRHGAIWGSDALQWRDAAADGGGLLLRRGPFDHRLRCAAAQRGATVVEGVVVSGGLSEANARGVTIVGDGGVPQRLVPRVVVVATGRRPADAPLPIRTVAAGPRTIAATFAGTANAPDVGTAVVEAVGGGWTWFQAPVGEVATVAVLVDADGDAPPGSRARALLGRCRGPAASLRAAPLRFAVDATARCQATDAPVLLVGDAAATIDPLASQGVEKALAAADHAAACVRTMLREPELAPLLRDEHRRWEHGLFAAHRRQSARFHAAETRFVDEPFWRRRRDANASDAGGPFADDVMLRLADGIRRTPALRRLGDTFERCDGAQLGDQRLTHLGFVPIDPLLAAFATPATLATALQRVGRDARCFVLPPFAVRQALRELVQRGWLVSAATAADTP